MKMWVPGHSEKVGPDKFFKDSPSSIRFNLKI